MDPEAIIPEVEEYFSKNQNLLNDFLYWRPTDGFISGRTTPEWYDPVWEILYKYSDDDGGMCNLLMGRIRFLMKNKLKRTDL